MALSIRALKNHLPTCDKPFLVHCEHASTVDYRGLLKRLAEGRTTITMPDALAVIELLWMELRKALAAGEIVKLPFGSFYLTAAGTFDSPTSPLSAVTRPMATTLSCTSGPTARRRRP